MFGKKELKGHSNSRPVRFDAASDLIIRQAMQDRKLNNYNLTVNIIIHEYGIVQLERLKAKATLLKEMLKWGFKPQDFEP